MQKEDQAQLSRRTGRVYAPALGSAGQRPWCPRRPSLSRALSEGHSQAAQEQQVSGEATLLEVAGPDRQEGLSLVPADAWAPRRGSPLPASLPTVTAGQTPPRAEEPPGGCPTPLGAQPGSSCPRQDSSLMAAQHKARCVLRSYRSGTGATSPLLLGSLAKASPPGALSTPMEDMATAACRGLGAGTMTLDPGHRQQVSWHPAPPGDQGGQQRDALTVPGPELSRGPHGQWCWGSSYLSAYPCELSVSPSEPLQGLFPRGQTQASGPGMSLVSSCPSLRPRRHQDEGGAGADRQARTDPGLGLPPGPGPAPSGQHRLLPTLRDTGGHVDSGKDSCAGLGLTQASSGQCPRGGLRGEPAAPPPPLQQMCIRGLFPFSSWHKNSGLQAPHASHGHNQPQDPVGETVLGQGPPCHRANAGWESSPWVLSQVDTTMVPAPQMRKLEGRPGQALQEKGQNTSCRPLGRVASGGHRHGDRNNTPWLALAWGGPLRGAGQPQPGGVSGLHVLAVQPARSQRPGMRLRGPVCRRVWVIVCTQAAGAWTGLCEGLTPGAGTPAAGQGPLLSSQQLSRGLRFTWGSRLGGVPRLVPPALLSHGAIGQPPFTPRRDVLMLGSSTTGSGFDTGSPLTSQVDPASSREQYMGAGQQTTPRDGWPLVTPGSARLSFILFDCFLKPQRDTQLLVKRSDLTPERVQHGVGLPAGLHLDPHSPASRGGGCSPPLPEPSRRSPEAPIGRARAPGPRRVLPGLRPRAAAPTGGRGDGSAGPLTLDLTSHSPACFRPACFFREPPTRDDVKRGTSIPPAATWRQALSKKVAAHRARAVPMSPKPRALPSASSRPHHYSSGKGEGGSQRPDARAGRGRIPAFPAAPSRTRRAGRPRPSPDLSGPATPPPRPAAPPAAEAWPTLPAPPPSRHGRASLPARGPSPSPPRRCSFSARADTGAAASPPLLRGVRGTRHRRVGPGGARGGVWGRGAPVRALLGAGSPEGLSCREGPLPPRAQVRSRDTEAHGPPLSKKVGAPHCTRPVRPVVWSQPAWRLG
ncbi:nascent polypeptide-associated complex subunit alpha, muscle-specific form-like [Eubalaena glacialis]|uniref:nascent polypeptide-associated complex subunit alpha, muscle-specific form-like n=1 Tax=Eubalaena glacialis TaxID=27606 RepID=UPI002A5A7E4A|nr:nascent polypeptide-associated complex subunit alpha, muscle-specific form-like [Eubalaena glacialis]